MAFEKSRLFFFESVSMRQMVMNCLEISPTIVSPVLASSLQLGGPPDGFYIPLSPDWNLNFAVSDATNTPFTDDAMTVSI